MSTESMINNIGKDVEIIRKGKIIATTKAYFSKPNKFDFKPDEQIQIGDRIIAMDTNQTFTIINIKPMRNGRGKLDHYEVYIE